MTRMRTLPLLFFLIVLVACTPEKEPAVENSIPADSIIPEAQMVLMLADAHMIESALQIQRNKGKNVSPEADYYYAGLFKKYGVSKERYQQNLEFYRKDPRHYIKLYDKVIRELTERERNFVKSIPR